MTAAADESVTASNPEYTSKDCAECSLSDLGNAQRLEGRFGQRLAFAAGIGWLHRDGDSAWTADNGEHAALRLAIETVDLISCEADAQEEAARSADALHSQELKRRARALRWWANESGSPARLRDMLTLAAVLLECDPAKLEPPLTILPLAPAPDDGRA